MEPADKKSEMHSLPPHAEAYIHNVIELGGNKTIMCSVFFLDIVAYSRKSVSQQMELKNCLNNSLAAAISDVPVDDRIILDTGDGAAISFLGDVEDALKVALILRESLLNEGAQLNPPLLVRSGINLGPVRLIKDINGQPNIVGDGINVAQRVMEFSQPGQILISRSYHDAISNLSQEYAGMLQYQGKFTDKHVREHEVYAVKSEQVIEESALDRIIKDGASPIQNTGRNRSIFDKTSIIFKMASSQPRILIGGIIIGVLLLVVARIIKVEFHTGLPAQPSAITPAQQGTKDEDSNVSKKPRPEQVEQENSKPVTITQNHPVQSARKTAPPVHESSKDELISQHMNTSLPSAKRAVTAGSAEMGSVSIAVTPWGEVYLDGKIQGISPPLIELEVEPGNHKIEIRNKTSRNYSKNILVKAGEKIVIKYKFTNPLE